MNNLLERLHASFFFYILTTPTTFLKIGHYLPSVILISVATMFGGLRAWVNAGWKKTVSQTKDKGQKFIDTEDTFEWETQRRPVLDSLLVMLATHTLGGLIFLSFYSNWTFAAGLAKLGFRASYIIGVVVSSPVFCRVLF